MDCNDDRQGRKDRLAAAARSAQLLVRNARSSVNAGASSAVLDSNRATVTEALRAGGAGKASEEGKGKERKAQLLAAAQSTHERVRNATSSVGTVIRSAISEKVRLQNQRSSVGHSDANSSIDGLHSEHISTQMNLQSSDGDLRVKPSSSLVTNSSPVSIEHEEGESFYVVVLEFVSTDAMILFICVLSMIAFPTLNDHFKASDESRPFPFAASSLIAAFAAGMVVGQLCGRTHWLASMLVGQKQEARATMNIVGLSHEQSVHSALKGIPPISRESKNKRGFLSLLGKNRLGSNHSFSHDVVPSSEPSVSRHLQVTKAWSMLNAKRASASSRRMHHSVSLPWQQSMDPTRKETLEHNFLMQNLVKRFNVRKKKRQHPIESTSFGDDDGSVAVEHGGDERVPSTTSHLGSFDLASSSADSLVGFVVDPLFRLRGMDVFLSEDPEHEAGTHPWFIEQGLRDVPSFTVNILTQWGNIFIYFEVPSNMFDMPVNEADADDVKAAKRFLRGSAEYRNARLKMIPSLVEGPLPIRMVAPPKKEKVVNCDYLPIYWKLHEEQELNERKLCTHLEATLDCMTSRTIRSMASLVKRYLHVLAIDIAVVVDAPQDQTDSEPEPCACLGLWRFNHIDVSMCPQLPDRFANEASPDVSRANMTLGMATSDFKHSLVQN